MSLPAISVRRPIGVAMISMAVCVFGWLAVTRLPVDLLPEVDFPRISIVTNYEGVGPQEMENLLTRPIERAVSTIDGVTALEGESAEGLSRVQMQFEWGVNLDNAANDIRAALDRIRDQLPEDAGQPIVLKFDISATPIATLGLSGTGDPRRLRYLADEVLTRRLERLHGIASVQVNGGRVREIRVELDLGNLTSLGVTGDLVVRALAGDNRNVSAGDMADSGKEVLVRTLGELTSVADIENVLVKNDPGGRPVYVKDVATVSDAFQEIKSEQWVDAKPGVIMRVSKQPGVNTVDVVTRLHAEIAQINGEPPRDRRQRQRDLHQGIDHERARSRDPGLGPRGARAAVVPAQPQGDAGVRGCDPILDARDVRSDVLRGLLAEPDLVRRARTRHRHARR